MQLKMRTKYFVCCFIVLGGGGGGGVCTPMNYRHPNYKQHKLGVSAYL